MQAKILGIPVLAIVFIVAIVTPILAFVVPIKNTQDEIDKKLGVMSTQLDIVASLSAEILVTPEPTPTESPTPTPRRVFVAPTDTPAVQ